jgi:riboflavin kinase/FMN adenylyltransferase
MNSIRAIAIGSFDGIHLAHQALINRAEAVAVIERGGGYLTPGYKRTKFTDRPCYFYLFEKICNLSPEEFVALLQEDFPMLEKIVVGYDFVFGKGKRADARVLQQLFAGEVEIVDEVKIEGISVHSRTIKAFLQEGEIQKANLLLGRNYLIEGRVVRGQGLGATSLVPTLNLKVESYQLPAEGVYVTRTCIADVCYPSVSFIGHRVSTDGSFAVESHIIGQEISTPKESVGIVFVERLRPNQKFDTLEALKTQIEEDISNARKVLS